MDRKIRKAFDEIKADERLKEQTLQYIRQYDENSNNKISSKKRPFTPKYVSVAACMLLFVSIIWFSYQTYFTPLSYVDMDVNPSIELVLNRFGKVIDAYAYNEDGDLILSSASVKYKSYDKAVTILIDTLNREGYITENGLLSVTVQSQTKEEELLASLKQNIGSFLRLRGINLEQDIFIVDSDTKNHSHELNVTPAKYLAISELQEEDPSVTMEECHGHTIRELREYTEQCRRRHRGSPKSESSPEETNPSHHGDSPRETSEETNDQRNYQKHKRQHQRH